MGVHAGQLALKSDLRLVQEYRRSLLPCLEQARRPTLDHHVYRSSGLGVWVLISENWYNDLKQAMARRRTPRDKAALKSGLTSDMRSLQRCPAKVRTFFQAPTVRYAA